MIYTASNSDTTGAALDAFEESELGRKCPQSVKVWRDAWERFVPFLQFQPAARRVLYTTNSIESLNAELSKATRNRGQFPNDTAALKALWLMICNIEDNCTAQRAKQAKRDVDGNGYIERAESTGWKQAIFGGQTSLSVLDPLLPGSKLQSDSSSSVACPVVTRSPGPSAGPLLDAHQGVTRYSTRPNLIRPRNSYKIFDRDYTPPLVVCGLLRGSDPPPVHHQRIIQSQS